MLPFDIKDSLAIGAIVLTFINHAMYIRDILSHRAEPHFFSWLIWTITQGTAATAIIAGGGGISGITLLVAAGLVATVAVISLRFGTKHLRKRDGVMFLTAVAGIIAWWQFDSPLLAVLLVTIVDIIGYLLTLLKIKRDHTTEPLTYWSLDLFGYTLLVFSLHSYTLQTALYPIAMCIMSICTVALLLYRRGGH